MNSQAIALRIWLLGLTLSFVIFSGTGIPSAAAMEARFGLSPDNSREVLLSTIESARSQLLINIYQFSDEEILGAIQDRIKSGVNVSVLIEGEPYRGMSAEGRKTLAALRKSMRQSSNRKNLRLFLMHARKSDGSRRFVYNHAKYIVVDSQFTLIASENFSGTGHAPAGMKGNRGWEVVLDDSDFAAQMKELFREDSDLRNKDVTDLVKNDLLQAIDPTSPSLLPLFASQKRKNPAIAIGEGTVSSATLITSPDAMSGLAKMIRSARSSLDVEHMSFPLGWRGEPSGESTWVMEVLKAAKRGVNVRVLLNDESVFREKDSTSLTPNEATVEFLSEKARCERLPLEARIVDIVRVGITYIHNKGMLADGRRALVSSINGSENSVVRNREVAVLLESEDAADYYGEAFDYDWKLSKGRRKPSAGQPCSPSVAQWFDLGAVF